MKQKRILVVEDEAIVAADLQDQLRALGYEPAGVAAAGEDAVSMARDIGADVVLMDIQLRGEIDGVEAARRVREQLDIPVIFLTAHADEATFERARITDPFGYIRKPFDRRELHTALEIALYRHATEAQLKKTQLWLQAVVENVGCALVVTDKWGLIEMMNSDAAALSGCPAEEALLRPLTAVFHLTDTSTQQPLHLPVGNDLESDSTPQPASIATLQNPAGNSTVLNLKASPIRDEGGRVTGLTWLFSRRTLGI